MAGRPATRVEIGLVDFIKLAYFYMCAVEQPDLVGECNLFVPCREVLSDIGANSQIRMTLPQLDNLIYHYKLAVMNRMNPIRKADLTKTEYQSIMQNLQRYLPEYVKPNRLGELELRGFHHDDPEGSIPPDSADSRGILSTEQS